MLKEQFCAAQSLQHSTPHAMYAHPPSLLCSTHAQQVCSDDQAHITHWEATDGQSTGLHMHENFVSRASAFCKSSISVAVWSESPVIDIFKCACACACARQSHSCFQSSCCSPASTARDQSRLKAQSRCLALQIPLPAYLREVLLESGPHKESQPAAELAATGQAPAAATLELAEPEMDPMTFHEDNPEGMHCPLSDRFLCLFAHA